MPFTITGTNCHVRLVGIQPRQFKGIHQREGFIANELTQQSRYLLGCRTQLMTGKDRPVNAMDAGQKLQLQIFHRQQAGQSASGREFNSTGLTRVPQGLQQFCGSLQRGCTVEQRQLQVVNSLRDCSDGRWSCDGPKAMTRAAVKDAFRRRQRPNHSLQQLFKGFISS